VRQTGDIASDVCRQTGGGLFRLDRRDVIDDVRDTNAVCPAVGSRPLEIGPFRAAILIRSGHQRRNAPDAYEAC
jgi:hypothetical protein